MMKARAPLDASRPIEPGVADPNQDAGQARTGPRPRRNSGAGDPSGERPRVDRREEILRAARIVLSERGYEATTVSEIVGRAGVAQGTFYLYFPSKKALILALTETMFTHLTRAAESAEERSTCLADAVLGVVGASFAQASAFRDVMDIVRSRGDGIGDASGSEREQQPYVSFFVGFIRRWQERGEVDAAIDPVLAGGILGALVGQTICRLYARYDDAPPASHVEEVARITLRSIARP
jgi:AcrR family transcriptional regulator